MLEQVRSCGNLAPLHNPANLLGIEAAQRAFQAFLGLVSSDAAFHMRMPAKAFRYAIPWRGMKNMAFVAMASMALAIAMSPRRPARR